MKPSLDTINGYASQHGFQPSTLKRLLDVITRPNALDQASQNALVDSFYPRQEVSTEMLHTVVGSLGHGVLKASLPTQQRLIKWLLMVYDTLEDPAILSRSYSFLFNLIDTLSLRADLCSLLARITRKKHVKPFRLQMLQDLLRKVGQEHSLLRLMRVYDRFAPGRINLENSKNGLGDFAHPDREWGNRLQQIQSKAHSHSTIDDKEQGSDGSAGSSKLELPLTSIGHASHRLDSIDDFTDGLLKPVYPDLTLHDLQDPALQSRATLEPNDNIMAAINDLLSSLLQQHLEKMEQGHPENRTLLQILEKALAFAGCTKVKDITSDVFGATLRIADLAAIPCLVF